MFVVGLIVGLLLGAVLGTIVFALCVAAGDGDDHMAEEE